MIVFNAFLNRVLCALQTRLAIQRDIMEPVSRGPRKLRCFSIRFQRNTSLLTTTKSSASRCSATTPDVRKV